MTDGQNKTVCDDGEDSLFPADLFVEPEGYRPGTPPNTVEIFERKAENIQEGSPKELHLNLIGKHSLWAHKLWNAGLSLTHYLDKNKQLYAGKRVLELGAAAAVPSIICAINGASTTVATDYPDPALINNIVANGHDNIADLVDQKRFIVQGLQWGQSTSEFFENLREKGGVGTTGQEKFDLIILADLIFNHTEHEHLLQTCQACLAPDGLVLTSYTHHVVKWAYRDDKFFDIAVQEPFHFQVNKIYEEKWSCMFPDDEGDPEIRSTVHCWSLRLPKTE